MLQGTWCGVSNTTYEDVDGIYLVPQDEEEGAVSTELLRWEDDGRGCNDYRRDSSRLGSRFRNL